MLIIPAIDIKNGKCVRLKQGNFNSETVYSNDPVTVAKRWESEGAQTLHVVDLDGAKNGKLVNYNIVKKIRETVQIPIQVGGGVCNKQSFQSLIKLDINKIIIGTMALENQGLLKNLLNNYPDQIIVSLDAKNGKLAINGWQKTTNQEITKSAQGLKRLGVKNFIYTNIVKDGTLSGPDYSGIKLLVQAIQATILAAGGISSIAEIKKLKSFNLEGVIIGKALYEGKIDLEEAKYVN